jgi:DNA-binding transcriptional MocR family regulator
MAGQVKFAYASADFANPTGETLPESARKNILDLAAELDIAVIEDAAYQSLRYDGDEVPPLLALDIERNGGIETTRTIYCGSFSKTLAPGLRVGWVCAAKPVISKLVLMKQAADLHSATLNQMAIHQVASDGFEAQVAKIKATYHGAPRRHAGSTCPPHARRRDSWTKPDGGMFVWVTLPEGFDGAALLAESIKSERVAFVPGKAFFADGSGANTIRLSFSCASEAMIEEGIKRLGRVVRGG